ncbi:MAG: 3-oxoacyl-ACP synthase [Cyclobacteriaceae bacterium]
MNLEERRVGLTRVCEDLIDKRIGDAQSELSSYSDQSKEETKSSAGDKYETARAMIHLEREKIASRLNELAKLKRVIGQISAGTISAPLGRLILTDKGSFFISVSLGLVKYDGEDFMAISPVAPLGNLLSKAKQGEVVSFNKTQYEIAEVAG